jgi:hypothetical protein
MRMRSDGDVACFRGVVWVSLVHPVLRGWLEATRASLERRWCDRPPARPWCGEARP